MEFSYSIQFQSVHIWRIRTYPLRFPSKCPSQRASLRFLFTCSSKLSDFQDFQDYAKPSRLLPATQVTSYKQVSQESVFSSIGTSSQSVYMVKLQTSTSYGSSLTDLNAGVLLCLIDEKGDSILQRIPAYVVADGSTQAEDTVKPEQLHFQKGSVDEFIFWGPQLGQVEALWISVESGQWRVAGVTLNIINASQSRGSFAQDLQYAGFHYDFRVEETLLGEGGDVSMLEAKPCLATELFGNNLTYLLTKDTLASSPTAHVRISNEESMKEYEDLKFSLLFYDVMLVSIGTSIAFISAGESSAFAFLIGGVGGFFYLLLLQRYVDGLPTADSISRNSGAAFGEAVQGLKGPMSSVAVAVVLSALAAKVVTAGNVPSMLTPREILVGTLGFLACKAAAVSAALKPLPVGFKKKQ